MKKWVFMIVLATSVYANSMLDECDVNNNWKIDTRKSYKIDWVPKAIAKKETKCSLTYELERLDKDSERLDKEIIEGRKKNKELDIIIKNLRKELAIVEKNLKEAKASLKEKQLARAKQREFLIRQIRKIKENAKNSSSR